MFGNAKTVLYARRKIILDNLETTGHNRALGHAMIVLNKYNATIEDIDVYEGTKNDENEFRVGLVLYIRCRCVDWANIEENLYNYVYTERKNEWFNDITTAVIG